MKIIYVGDNRNRGNYGCRATSTALSLMIRENHNIVGRVTGNTTSSYPNVFYFRYFPQFIYKLLGKSKVWAKIQPFANKVLFKIADVINRHDLFDFVSNDMDKSIKNLKKCLPANSQLMELNLEQYDFDGIVVNGEGSFIFCTPQWREPLVLSMCIHWAQKLGKKVFFMNAMFSDKPGYERNEKTLNTVNELLSKCEIVIAREHISYEYVKKYLKSVSPQLIPDALFTWYDLVNDGHQVTDGKYYLAHQAECDDAYYNLCFDKPYILVSGSSSDLIGNNPNHAIETYSYLVNKIKHAYNGEVFLIQVCEGDEFLKEVATITLTPLISMETPIIAAAKILANAQAFISGRYHPGIMASLGGTPCVFMGSNSHKTFSLQQLLNYDEVIEFHVLPNVSEIDQIVDLTLTKISTPHLREKIKSRCQELSNNAKSMKNLIK